MKIIHVADPASVPMQLRKATIIQDSLLEDAKAIMRDVSEHGDPAVLNYTSKFDGARLDSLRVSEQEMKQAYAQVTKDQIMAVKLMKQRLIKSELAILKRLKGIAVSSEGVRIDRMVKPVTSVGCYIPGGKARYPSTVVMCAVPAKVAGLKRVVALSPPRKDGTIDPLTLVAADICRVDEFYKVGGAQGIAALAYGTQSIKPVNKIVGPGGMFVTAAKLIASATVSTDMVAGPTELLIYADASADSQLIAVDLISQAEHSTDTVCGLVTTSDKLASEVQKQVESIIKNITRSDIVKKSLENNGFIVICRNESSCIEFVNEFAPEHLEIMCKYADAIAKKIDSAGLVLIGPYAPSSASDYSLGSNHVLPTLGFGKSRASLSVLDFVKIVNKVKVNKSGLAKVDRSIREITSAEGLLNHYEAVKARMNEKKE
ncbi:MAG: histidinol dehydrogenase [Nitrososphaeraceae archaeon]|jgi:histidinol dehydrogenase|nr:hisD [Nitrososphaera sp.]MDW0121383.1 histidinol dehydrogenase [Nitrososphaeraceae archaeon]MDW0140851.1 histidinol dehydrogenase [Nitrososphaeraceae archaeon]